MTDRFEECDYCQFNGEDEDVCEFCENADQFEPAADDYSEGALFSKKILLLKRVA
jgi:hypothetical protein